MPDYAALQAKARDMIGRFGQTAELQHEGKKTSVKIVPLDYSLGLLGTPIAAGTRLVYMEATPFEPIPEQDVLYIKKKAHRVVGPVRKLDPDGTVLYYELSVRGG